MIYLYISNVFIAFARILKATVGVYKYLPEDSYVKNWWVTVDCFVNALLGGDPDETLSSRIAKYRASNARWACVFCKFLTWCQNTLFKSPGDHCDLALERNKGSRAVIPDAQSGTGT